MAVAVSLEKDDQHVPVFQGGPPQPVPHSTNLDGGLAQRPPRTPAGFSVAPFLGKEWREYDVPLPSGLMADPNAALVEQFQHVTLAERQR
ncbi:hypothetical protein GCM10008949_48110 [Deinococcus humi]|nr:hypothetical protein GCM10008949_48110 [Deinococcus humi]